MFSKIQIISNSQLCVEKFRVVFIGLVLVVQLRRVWVKSLFELFTYIDMYDALSPVYYTRRVFVQNNLLFVVFVPFVVGCPKY